LDEPLRTEFLILWLEFEEEATPDAIFACAIDRIMPFILKFHTSGKAGQKPGLRKNKSEICWKMPL
jgi:putative hydrolase of HD superfamily